MILNACFNKALQRFNVEPQRSANLDRGDIPQPGLPVHCVNIQAEKPGGLLDFQEPLTDITIGYRRSTGSHVHLL